MSVIVSGEDYVKLPRAVETWLIEPLVPAGGTCLIYGPPKAGKSVAALMMSQAIQNGADWLGYPVRQRGPVVYVQLDNPRSLWATRLIKTIQRFPEVGLPLCADKETLDTYPSFDILNQTHADLLTVALREITPSPVAVIIDTLIKSHSAKENDPTEMTRVMARLTSAVRPAALIIVAHSRKNPTHEYTPSVVDDNRGSNSVVGEMDAIISMTKSSMSIVGRAIEDTTFRTHLEEDVRLWRGAEKLPQTEDNTHHNHAHPSTTPPTS